MGFDGTRLTYYSYSNTHIIPHFHRVSSGFFLLPDQLRKFTPTSEPPRKMNHLVKISPHFKFTHNNFPKSTNETSMYKVVFDCDLFTIGSGVVWAEFTQPPTHTLNSHFHTLNSLKHLNSHSHTLISHSLYLKSDLTVPFSLFVSFVIFFPYSLC